MSFESGFYFSRLILFSLMVYFEKKVKNVKDL